MSDLSKPSPTQDETREQSATYENCVDNSHHTKEIEPCTGSEQQSSMMEFQALEDEEEEFMKLD